MRVKTILQGPFFLNQIAYIGIYNRSIYYLYSYTHTLGVIISINSLKNVNSLLFIINMTDYRVFVTQQLIFHST